MNIGGPSLNQPTEEPFRPHAPSETIQGNVLNIPPEVIPHLKGPDGERHVIDLEEWMNENDFDAEDILRMTHSNNRR